MRHILRWSAAMLAILLLCAAALLGLSWYASTGFYAERALGSDALIEQQQARIDTEVATLADKWHFAPETLSPWTADAARAHREPLRTWWNDLWHGGEADTALPAFLTPAGEREMVAALMADPVFTSATDPDMQRTIARDEIAYAVDEAVCQSVLPLRRSVIDLGLSMALELIDLPVLSRLLGVCALCLAVIALVLLAFAHKAAGSALTAAGGWMFLFSIPVWLLDIPGMLDQLSPIAESQGIQALLWLALPWYGAAMLLLAAGQIIIRARN